MNEVAIPRQDFEDGQTLPRVCALSGESADRLYRRKLVHLPKWVYALIPLGIPFVVALKIVVEMGLDRFTDWTPPGSVWIPFLALPFALGWYFKAVQLPGWIPLAIDAHREVVRQRQLRWASAVAFVIFGFIATLSIQSWGTVGVLPGLLAVLALGSFFSLSWELGSLDVGVCAGPGNHRVTLSNVHPTFALASVEQFGRSSTTASR